jgi:lysozyme
MKIIGADVSHWEGAIDWQQAARWIPFVYFKCTDGIAYIDNTYELNRAGCAAAGMPHAPYHYYQPELDPIAQADHFIQAAGKDFKVYMVDVEEGKPKVGDLLVFLKHVKQLTGQVCAIYTSAGYWNANISPKPEWAPSYPLVVAHYTAEHRPLLPTGWSTWQIWQFSDAFYFPGCDTAADGDWFNGSLGQMRAWFGNYKEIEPVFVSLRARSLCENLHIRMMPSKSSREVGHLAKGESIDIDYVSGRDVWLQHSRGWSALEIDGYRYMEIIR